MASKIEMIPTHILPWWQAAKFSKWFLVASILKIWNKLVYSCTKIFYGSSVWLFNEWSTSDCIFLLAMFLQTPTTVLEFFLFVRKLKK